MQRPSAREIRAFRTRLLAWFRIHGRRFSWRRARATLYQRVLPEVLLQRTRASVVAAFLPRFIARYPSWDVLASATIDDLHEHLKPLGLWRRRGESLLALASVMSARNGRFPRRRSEIEQLPGVGQYIANAICLFALKQAEPLLDVNMARVLERCFGPRKLADIRYDPVLQEVARRVVDGAEPARINWAILDLAARVCTPRGPLCWSCALAVVCAEGKRRIGAGYGPPETECARMSLRAKRGRVDASARARAKRARSAGKGRPI